MGLWDSITNFFGGGSTSADPSAGWTYGSGYVPDYFDNQDLATNLNNGVGYTGSGTEFAVSPTGQVFSEYDTNTPMSPSAATGLLNSSSSMYSYNNGNMFSTPTSSWMQSNQAMIATPQPSDAYTGIMGSIKEIGATVDSAARSLFGDKTNLVYAAAISAGAQAIMQYFNNQNVQDYNDKVRREQNAREDAILDRKYEREDEELARRSAVPTRGGNVAYRPGATTNYRVPGSTNQVAYGLINGGR